MGNFLNSLLGGLGGEADSTLGGIHSSDAARKRRCKFVNTLPAAEKCNFIKNSTCDHDSGLVEYHYFMFCTIPNPASYDPIFLCAVLAMLILLLLLFFYLAVTVDDFFCPILGVISKSLRLSENLAGVTILALGNGAPDIISSIFSSAQGETIVMYNQLLGGAMFVTSFVAGMVAFVRPFHLQIFPFLRDLIFIIGSISWIQYASANERINNYQAASFIIIYFLYIAIAVGGYCFNEKFSKKYNLKIKLDEENVDWSELHKTIDAENSEQIRPNILPKKERKSLCTEFCINLKPFTNEEWKTKGCCGKVLLIVKIPLVFVLKLFIPIVNFESYNNGWCKLLNSINIALYPILVILLTKTFYTTFFGITIFAYIIPCGIILGLLVFCTSKQNKPPVYHILFALLTLVGAMLVIFNFVKEIVAILSLFGTLCSIKKQTLGLTILAWGNGLGDAITNISLARRGFQRMAFTGCFAGALATTLLSMGISLLMIKGHDTHVRGGIMGPVCSVFLLINLSFSLLFVLLTHFEARKSYGLFLIIIYVQFLLFCLLSEIRFIHPFGTDHEYDTDLFDSYERVSVSSTTTATTTSTVTKSTEL